MSGKVGLLPPLQSCGNQSETGSWEELPHSLTLDSWQDAFRLRTGSPNGGSSDFSITAHILQLLIFKSLFEHVTLHWILRSATCLGTLMSPVFPTLSVT